MMHFAHIRTILLSIVSVFLLATSPFALALKASDSGAGAFESGDYRNLFLEDGHSAQEIQAKIIAAYQQLFHGDPKTQAIAYLSGSNANGPLMYVNDVHSGDVRTEGMSYGMMIAVQLNKKADFDAIWNWAKTYMYIANPKHPSYGYFSWSCKIDGTPNEETPAPDGEEYFAMALLFAGNRWPGGQGIYDYHAEALRLLTTMRHHAVVTGPTSFGPRTVGPEVSEKEAMILFVPVIRKHSPPFTDPSYHLPAFYELWALWGPVKDRAFWAHAAEVSRGYFLQTTNPQTGLAPSYSNFDGTPHFTKFPMSGIFAYDAWRTASNWSVDWSWWHKAPAEQQLSDRIQKFFAAQGLDKYGPLYTLDGRDWNATKKLPQEVHPVGLTAANAVAGLAATDRDRARLFTEALWNAPIPTGEYRYYDGVLYLMGLMHASGEFRIWPPQ